VGPGTARPRFHFRGSLGRRLAEKRMAFVLAFSTVSVCMSLSTPTSTTTSSSSARLLWWWWGRRWGCVAARVA